MSKLEWDKTGERFFETGTSHGVLYKANAQGVYDSGYAWNGLTAVSKSPSGAEATAIYADNIKYLNLVSAEEFAGTITAYSSPVEFDECDGSISPVPGVSIGQQTRRPFGFSWQTKIGNDLDGQDHAYKIHIIYNALAAPSERAYATVNESPEAMELSWEVTTTPVDAGAGYKPTATVEIDSRLVPAAKMKLLEDRLYGTTGTPASLPLPAEIYALVGQTVTVVTPTKPTQSGNVVTIPDVTGVIYTILGETVTGEVNIESDVLVVARPATGYTFPDVTDNDWLFTHS